MKGVEMSLAIRRGLLLMGLGAALLGGGTLLAGCGDSEAEGAPDTSVLSGAIAIDGSSTVAPLTEAAAQAFQTRTPGVSVEVKVSGTGGGFEVFCKGQSDIQNASRRITPQEFAACKNAGVGWEELQIAFDGVTVVTRRDVDIGTNCLTLAELRRAWRAGSDVSRWSQVSNNVADLPLALAGPDGESGTYDFFNETVLGVDVEGSPLASRSDYAASADDNVTVRRIEDAPAAMGYFGYSYYVENQGRLRALSLDDGRLAGCTPPTPTTITSGAYPLSRPLYLYVSTRSLERPEVLAFLRYYLENARTLAESVSIVPTTALVLERELRTVLASG